MSDLESKALRPHSKSRSGCKICKQRRVKCNEVRPKCDSCQRRDERCEYLDELPRNRKTRYNTTGRPPSTRHDSSSPLQETHWSPLEGTNNTQCRETTERRLLEIRLMHHFITSTVQNDFLSTHELNVSEVWLKAAPTLALDHPFLMNAILSIAALHISKTKPSSVDMSRTHRLYLNAALCQHREAVQNLNASNAEAACVSAILISLPPIALLPDGELHGTLNYSPPVHIFHLLAGNIPLFTSALPFIPPTSDILSIIDANPNLTEFQRQCEVESFSQPFAALSTWRAEKEYLNKDKQVAYEMVLRYIGCILFHIETGLHTIQLRQLWHAFPMFAPPVFVEGLRVRDPRALVILAYFFSLTTSMDNVWWLRGIAESEVMGIQSILPAEWQWAMEFALQRISVYRTTHIRLA